MSANGAIDSVYSPWSNCNICLHLHDDWRLPLPPPIPTLWQTTLITWTCLCAGMKWHWLQFDLILLLRLHAEYQYEHTANTARSSYHSTKEPEKIDGSSSLFCALDTEERKHAGMARRYESCTRCWGSLVWSIGGLSLRRGLSKVSIQQPVQPECPHERVRRESC